MIYMLVIFVYDKSKESRERKVMMFGKDLTWLYQLVVCTFELESELVVDIDDFRVFGYSNLCRCSKDAFSRCLTLWGLDGIEKDFVDVFGSISGYSYRRDRDGWSMD
jgi:hypothetical protein